MYGVVGTVSIGSMFLTDIIPGLILGLALVVISYITAKKKGYQGTGEIPTFKDILKSLNEPKVSFINSGNYFRWYLCRSFFANGICSSCISLRAYYWGICI